MFRHAAQALGAKQGGAAGAGVFALLAALEAVLPPAAHLAALGRLAGHASAAVRRRALRLFAARLGALREQETLHETLPTLPKTPGTAAPALAAEVADAALAIAGQAPGLLAGDQPPGVRQAAAAALGAAAALCGAARPRDALAMAPALVQALADPRGAVRGSALAALAALALALGARVLPALPTLAPAVLGAAERAVAGLGAAAGSGAGLPRVAGANAVPVEGAMEVDGEAVGGGAGEVEAAGGGAGAEEAAVEAAAAVAALGALVRHVAKAISFMPRRLFCVVCLHSIQMLSLYHGPLLLQTGVGGWRVRQHLNQVHSRKYQGRVHVCRRATWARSWRRTRL